MGTRTPRHSELERASLLVNVESTGRAAIPRSLFDREDHLCQGSGPDGPTDAAALGPRDSAVSWRRTLKRRVKDQTDPAAHPVEVSGSACTIKANGGLPHPKGMARSKRTAT